MKKYLYVTLSADGTPKSNHLNYYLFEYENIDYIRFHAIISLLSDT
jgi:hypothetical protein